MEENDAMPLSRTDLMRRTLESVPVSVTRVRLKREQTLAESSWTSGMRQALSTPSACGNATTAMRWKMKTACAQNGPYECAARS